MIDYATNAPQGHMGDWRRGSPLGRPSILPEADVTTRVELRRVHIDRNGYDEQGAYHGVGEPMWWAATEDGSVDTTFRAVDCAAALVRVRSLLPLATVDLAAVAEGADRDVVISSDPGLAAYLATMIDDVRMTEEDDRAESGTLGADAIAALPETTYQASLADWRRFETDNAADIAAACDLEPGGDGFSFARRAMTRERIGSTLWLVRTGSGVGFTDDGDAPCLERLDAAARAMDNIEAYSNDDGEVHLV